MQGMDKVQVEDVKKVMENFIAVVHALNTHQEIHFDILDLINSELQSRPTFKQTFECFKECVHTHKEVSVIEMAR
jgi:hypothetical protein